MEMHNPMHPGEFIQDVYLTPYSLSVVELAEHLGIPVAQVASVIDRRSGVTAELAIRLSEVLGASPRFWMGMQSSYDISLARKHVDVSHLKKMSFPELEEVPHPDKYYV